MSRTRTVDEHARLSGVDVAAVWARVRDAFENVFGGERADGGWFVRKRQRECVEASLSVVATEGERVVGFVLVGRPSSLRPVARTAGVAVLPSHQRRGVARDMVGYALDRARAVGCQALRSDVSMSARPAYVRLGFATLCERAHLLRHAAVDAGPVDAGIDWSADLEPPPTPVRPECGWFAEAWAGTPPAERTVLPGPEDGDALGVSREPAGVLVHWIRSLNEPAVTLAALPWGTPAFVFGARDGWSPPGWAPSQRFFEMRLE